MTALQLPPGASPSIVRGAVSALTRLRSAEKLSILRKGWEGVVDAPLVYGFGIAERVAGSRCTGELCVRFYVRRKVAVSRLRGGGSIPKYVTVRTQSGERVRIPTDVVAMPTAPVAHRVLPAASSIGHVSGLTDGTFGLAVLDGENRPFLLTCAHVAAPPFDANPQDDVVESPPDPDGKPGRNSVGTVTTWTQLFPNGPVNICDAALVSPLKSVQLTNAPLRASEFGGVSTADFVAGSPNLAIQVASPRGMLSGSVTGVANDVVIRIFDQLYRFSGIVEHSALTVPGDSGSAVLQVNTGRIVGLHFAGLSNPHRAYYIPAAAIVRQFGDPRLRPLPK